MTYAVSKSLVRSPDHAALLPHVAMMRKTNRIGRPHRQVTQPPSPAAPIPTAQS